MAKSVTFMHNKEYGATDINNIIGTLATKGVVNEADTSCMVTAGTGNSVNISPGKAIMNDGSTIEIIGSEAVTLASTTNKNYIFFRRESNDISINASTVMPSADDVVLAEVTGSNIVDKRSDNLSSFKITRGLGNGYFVKKNFKLTAGDTTTEFVKIHEENVGTNVFQYALIIVYRRNSVSNPYIFTGMAFIDYSLPPGANTYEAENIMVAGIRDRITYNSAYENSSIKLIYNGNNIEIWHRGSRYAVDFYSFDIMLF